MYVHEPSKGEMRDKALIAPSRSELFVICGPTSQHLASSCDAELVTPSDELLDADHKPSLKIDQHDIGLRQNSREAPQGSGKYEDAYQVAIKEMAEVGDTRTDESEEGKERLGSTKTSSPTKLRDASSDKSPSRHAKETSIPDPYRQEMLLGILVHGEVPRPRPMRLSTNRHEHPQPAQPPSAQSPSAGPSETNNIAFNRPQKISTLEQETMKDPLHLKFRMRRPLEQVKFLQKHTPLNVYAATVFGQAPGTFRPDLFRTRQRLGSGSYGSVWKSIDKKTNFPVATKVITKSKHKGHLEWLRREVDIHHRLVHDNIIKFYGVWQTPQAVVLVLEFAGRGTLGDVLDTVPSRELNERCAARYVYNITSALDYLHKRGIWHRDLKPDNILILDGEQLKICDFGFALRLSPPDGNKQESTSGFGTVEYSAPETIIKPPVQSFHYDHTVDIWSLGVIMYEMLLGRLPSYCKRDDDNPSSRLPGTLYIPGTISRASQHLIRSVSSSCQLEIP